MKRSIWFNLLIVIMLILVGGVLFRSYVIWSTNDFLFKEHFGLEDSVMPTWYPITSIVLALISFIGVILTYFYRKIGVYATIIGLFLSIVMQPEFMPDGTLYSMFTLFVFIGYGLAVIIPHWKEFK
mgnify:CR=1 FL=1